MNLNTQNQLNRFLLLFKVLFLFIFIFSSQLGRAQNQKITLTGNDLTIRTAFDQIEKQTQMTIDYEEFSLDHSKKISNTIQSGKLSEIMTQLLKETNCNYTIKGSHIVITPKPKVVKGKVTGVVLDEKGQSMIGVSILVKGTSIGTITDNNGKFSVDLGDKSTLKLSYIGYESIDYNVGSQTNVTIRLKEDAKNLEEVVVIGYGTQKIGSVTGAMSKVSNKEIVATPVSSLNQALQGRASGVLVTNNGGAPGTNPIVQIRGVGSINFNSDPLYVVDGVPTGSFYSIAPADVESMDILKDASATAIYGSRGSNGVVIITTKKGKNNDKYNIEYNGYIGTQNAAKQLSLLNHDQYLQYGTDLLNNAGLTLPARWADMNQPIYAGATQTFAQTDTDWQKAMFRSATIQEHNISLSGGTAKSKFYTSAGYYNQDGIMIGTNYKRLNVRLNSTHEISKFLSFGETFNIANAENTGEKMSGNRPQIMHMIRAVPYMPIYDPTLDGGFRGPDGIDGTDYENPVRIAMQPTSTFYSFTLLGSAFAELRFTDWLKYKSTVGLEFNSGRRFAVTPTFVDGSYHSLTKEAINDYRATGSNWMFTNQVTADKTIGNHYINAVLVAEQTKIDSYGLNAGGNLPDNTVQQLSNPTDLYLAGGLTQEALISYIGRVQYSYAGKYLLSASYRADGSSKFAPGNKWGQFKSFSGGWRLKEESFLKNVDAISDLKIRASYGETGFNGIGNYVWQSNENVNGSFYMLGTTKSPASFFDQLGNKDLKWETTNMTNIGIDLKLFVNSLSISAEYYNRLTDNLILSVTPAPSIGYAQSTSTNIGSMSNKGFEFQVGYDKQLGDFHLNVSGNISANKNEVLKLDLPTSEIFAGANSDFGGDPITRTRVGDPIQEFYGYKTDGIFQTQAEIDAAPTQAGAKPGDIKFKDLSGPNGLPDGKIDAYDRANLGSYLPKFQYGFNLALTYKGFDFTTFFQGTYGSSIYNANRVTLEGMTRLFNAGTQVLNAWTPTNTNTNIPRAVSGDPNRNARVSDRFIEDGSYLRLKNLTIGYTVPADFLKSLTQGNVQKIRIYASGQNLLTFTKYSGYDPEIGNRSGLDNANLIKGIDYGQYPQPQTFLCGIQVGF